MCNFTPTLKTDMENLKNMLNNPKVRGVLCSATGEIVEFHNPGVKDLFILVNTRPQVLDGAAVADRVIGRGAAMLLVLGNVKQVYAKLISEPAIKVLREACIPLDYEKAVPNIINRDGTDVCPVEKLTMNITEPSEAFERIKEFLINKNIIQS